ncbi:hypothetical protein [Streptomyces sp. SID13031]|uniref:hypothetical protein n=1 Tax=Streptomyces sp. SID13031 TaxID=2706046 RepID=UPI0013C858E7|nr:hypothetical protein [Streptomyces sp. SID13031]NEA31898.1 hypothetical protein [Streptomyces sp. SID13031]
MRKTIAAATAALMMLAGAQVPAWAAGPEAPTDVQVAWTNTTTGRFKITWTDGGEENRVRIEYENTDPPIFLTTQKAGAPNEVSQAASSLRYNQAARIVVVSHDEAGAESAAAYSPWFDLNRPAEPSVLSSAALADGSVRVSWYRDQAIQDTTPNDPLDRPSTDEHVVTEISSKTGLFEEFLTPTEAKSMTIPPRPRPYLVSLSARNEWGESVDIYRSNVHVTTLTAALSVPAVGQYSGTIGYSAAVGSPECASTTCGYGPVYLQARADATKPWATVGKYDGTALKFTGAVGVPGGRQYRLYVPAWSYQWDQSIVAPPISTSARYSAAQAKFTVVGFNTTSARVGQLVKATVNVLPAGTVKASLEWYDGKAWHHGAYIPLTKGKGTLTFKASGRGTTRYWRVTVPKMTMNGLPILATPSRSFKLGVR